MTCRVCRKHFTDQFQVRGKIPDHWAASEICDTCSVKVPEVLAKACSDHPFDYAVGLGGVAWVRFTTAVIVGEWVHLAGCENNPLQVYGFGLHRLGKPSPSFDRGLWVRLDQIAWAADAPYGS